MAKVIFQDEEGQFLNRYQLVPVDGQPNIYDLVRVAVITKQGTAYNKEVGDHFLQVEDGVPVQTLACTKVGTVYTLTGLTATAGKVPVLFSAPAAYAVGDTVTIDGTAYALSTRDGSALTGGAWAAEKIITGVADVDAKTLTVQPSAPVGAAKPSDIPTALKNPQALTVQNGYGNTPATYDGSAPVTISVPHITINAAAPTGTLGDGELWGVY